MMVLIILQVFALMGAGPWDDQPVAVKFPDLWQYGPGFETMLSLKMNRVFMPGVRYECAGMEGNCAE